MFSILVVTLLLAVATIVAIQLGHKETKERLNALLAIPQPSNENRQTYALLYSNLAASSEQKKWALIVIGATAIGLGTFIFGKTLTSAANSIPLATFSFLITIVSYMVLSKIVADPTQGLPQPDEFGSLSND